MAFHKNAISVIENVVELTAKFMNNNLDNGIINDEAIQSVMEILRDVEARQEIDDAEKQNQKAEK